MVDEISSHPTEASANLKMMVMQEELKALKADRDRQIFEKGEIVQKANSFAKERDDLREQLVTANEKIDQLICEQSSILDGTQQSTHRAEIAEARLRAAEAELLRLKEIIEHAPPTDPAEQLKRLAIEKTSAAVEFLRKTLPENSTLRIFAVQSLKKSADALMAVKPQVIDYVNRGRRQLEERLNKK